MRNFGFHYIESVLNCTFAKIMTNEKVEVSTTPSVFVLFLSVQLWRTLQRTLLFYRRSQSLTFDSLLILTPALFDSFTCVFNNFVCNSRIEYNHKRFAWTFSAILKRARGTRNLTALTRVPLVFILALALRASKEVLQSQNYRHGTNQYILSWRELI